MKLVKYMPMIVVALVLIGAGVWLTMPEREVSGMGVPIPKPKMSMADQEKSLIGELKTGSGKPSKIQGNWAQFLGPDGDGINKEKISLATQWPESGPSKVWELTLAKGHAGASIYKGMAYIHDYDSSILSDVIRCVSLDSGKEIWRYTYPIKTKTNHGITRAVPAVNDKFLVTIGPKCQVYCLNAVTGEFIWSKSLVLDYGTIVPKWYSGQCPILEGDKAIIAPCGPKGFLVKIDCATGNIDWTAENKMGWDMTHTSIAPMELFDGTKTYVYSGSGGVAGVHAETGEVLWVNSKWKIKIAACATPVIVDKERIFLSAGYSAGSMMMKVKKNGDKYGYDVLYSLEEKVFGSVQHTPILYKGHIYGTRPNGELVCLGLDGKPRWASGTEKFGIGPFLMANNYMYVLDSKTCNLTMVDINENNYNPIAKANVFKGHDAYGLMAISHGLLILRDLTKMVAVDISANGFKTGK